MLYLFYFCIIIINITFHKHKEMLLMIDFIGLFILLGFSYGAYDNLIFIRRYMYPEQFESYTEPLFNLIVNISNKIGLSYRQFIIIISIFILLFIFNFIKDKSNNIGYAIALYLIYPAILVFAQLRFLMAFSIVLNFGIGNLIKKPKFYKIRATLAIVIASLIHFGAAFYLLFVLLENKDTKKIVFFTSIICILVYCIGFIPNVANIMSKFISEEKVEILIFGHENVEGNFGRAITSLLIIVGYIIYYYLFLVYGVENKKEQEYDKLILNFNIISIISIPLILKFSMGFLRIPNSMMLLNYIAISHYFEKKNKNNTILCISTFIFSFILMVMVVHTPEAIERVITPFFEQNELFF